ncbi:hypothetical protein CAEBREN_21445 [Caenorhabditis brenneri]|uniref:Uncharacterized protein n=1 Tax=Caenorhabditis brenneri TaxID=135651 RepID=G0MF01_CAEBE|nr:hypothetical protein CAEBREN_21445 [Caenorhabditis brenneri]
MDPLPPPMPSFSDVLDMVETIPNAEDVERVTVWAKDKYSSESKLEAKVERLEKNLVNSEFKVRNLEENVSSLRLQLNHAQWFERCVMDQDKQLEKAKTDEGILKAEIVNKDEKILELFDKCHEREKTIEEQTQTMIEMMETINSLRKQTAYYEEEITKLLDEKEKMLNEVEEDSDASDDDDDDDDEDSGSDSDDSGSSDSDSNDEPENEVDFWKTQLEGAEALLLLSNKELIESKEQHDKAYKDLELKAENAEKKASEAEAECETLRSRLEDMTYESRVAMEKEKTEKNQILLKLSEETKKAQETAQENKQILLKLSEETKRAQEMEQLQKTEIGLLKKNVSGIQAANRIEMDMIKAGHSGVVTKLTDQIRELHSKCQHIVNSNAANVMRLQEEFVRDLKSKSVELETIQKSEKEQREKRLVSQDKLVAQMEINMQLQKDVIELTRQIQALQAIDDAESAIGVEEQVAVGEDVEIGEEQAFDIDYSSDSSFEPVDEHDL